MYRSTSPCVLMSLLCVCFFCCYAILLLLCITFLFVVDTCVFFAVSVFESGTFFPVFDLPCVLVIYSMHFRRALICLFSLLFTVLFFVCNESRTKPHFFPLFFSSPPPPYDVRQFPGHRHRKKDLDNIVVKSFPSVCCCVCFFQFLFFSYRYVSVCFALHSHSLLKYVLCRCCFFRRKPMWAFAVVFSHF